LLGVHHFIDDTTEDVAAALNRLGGERAALAPVTNAKAMTPVIDGLAVRSHLIVIGVDAEPIQGLSLQLIGASRSIVGHAAGTSIDPRFTYIRGRITAFMATNARVTKQAEHDNREALRRFLHG
jgi:D-arabinose 1-dehydrogenase-like Zn-dependent alcohol dehydrogenase